MSKYFRKRERFSDNQNNKNEKSETKIVAEPRPICSLCGEPIEAIIEAIREGENSYSHFDCVIKKIEEEYNVKAPDKVSYIGAGTFAVVTVEPATKSFTIKQRINYESVESFSQMKKYVEENKI